MAFAAFAAPPSVTCLANTALPPVGKVSETPDEKAGRLRRLSQIPFVQLEVEHGNDDRFSGQVRYLGHCFFDGVVRRSFQRADVLPVGRHVRVQSDCSATPQRQMAEAAPGVWVNLLSSPDKSDFVTGRLLQMHLMPAYGPPDGFDKIGEVVVAAVPTDHPIDDSAGEAYRASHLNDYAELDRNGPSGPGVPPAFPLADVVVTYKEPGRPGSLFRASYRGSTWRMRVEQLNVRDPRTPVVINDAFAQTETWIWDASRTYAVQMTDSNTRFGAVARYWKPIFETQGTSVVAGLPCTEYHVRSELAQLGSTHVCMTDDGVVLRRNDPDGHRSEAVAVKYEPVSRAQVTVSEDYHPRRH